MLDLRQLRYFIAVAETENVGRAAQHLHISQSPLSRQIKQLEDHLGVLLFERDKKRIKLTREGRDFLGEARALVLNAERTEAFGRRLGNGEAGRLAIGYVEGAIHGNLVSEILRRFLKNNPLMTLGLQGLNTTSQFEQLKTKILDVGLTYRAPDEDSGLTSLVVFDEPLSLAIPKNHPLAKVRSIKANQLHGQPWIVVARQPVDTVRPALVAACQRAGFTPDICYEATDPLSCLHLVGAGLGLAVVQSSLKSIAPAEVVLKQLPWFDLRVSIYLVWRKNDERAQVLRFIEAAPVNAILK